VARMEQINNDTKLALRVLGVGVGRNPISPSKLKGEAALCAEIVNYLKEQNLSGKLKAGWFHVANECDHSSATNLHYTLAKRKTLGVISGVPDFVFFWDNGQCGFIEVKYKNGRLSDSQKDFYYYWLRPYNQRFVVARNLDDIKEALYNWKIIF
jgi:hypothetical protein